MALKSLLTPKAWQLSFTYLFKVQRASFLPWFCRKVAHFARLGGSVSIRLGRVETTEA